MFVGSFLAPPSTRLTAGSVRYGSVLTLPPRMSGRVCTRRRRRLTARLRLAFLAPLFGVAIPVVAQPTAPVGVAVPQSTTLPRALRDQTSGSGVALEGVIDAESYVVGPGDVFAFAIGGRIPMEQRSTVTADGMLIVPEVGSFRVGGRSLLSVRTDLRAALRRRYTNIDTDAALAEPRRFLVHVTGAVTVPGRHAVMPMARVEDALAEAMGDAPLTVLRDQQAEMVSLLPALRNVRIIHRDGTEEYLDLLRYYSTGDIRDNPFLLDGDVVHVPSFNRQGAAVFVEDRFGEPRLFDLRPGDTAADLVAVARGPEAHNTLEAVRLLRMQPNGALSVETFSGAGLEASLQSTTLQPLDRLLLVDPNELAGRIEVDGAVRFPGTYPVTEGRTTLADVVEMAGGLRPNALARAAYLDRPGAQRPPYQPFDAALRLANQEDQAFESGRLAPLNFESRQYLSRELSAMNRVSIDLEGVLNGTAAPVPLFDGDRLVVPEDPGGVLVVGQVGRPGLVPLRAGARADHYIAAAGGRGPAATETYIREAGSGALRPADEAEIHSGDVLFVDRGAAAFSESQQSLLLQRQQYEAQVRRDRAEARNRFFSTALGITSAVISVVTIIILSNNSNSN